jgi:hypothetical protein
MDLNYINNIDIVDTSDYDDTLYNDDDDIISFYKIDNIEITDFDKYDIIIMLNDINSCRSKEIHANSKNKNKNLYEYNKDIFANKFKNTNVYFYKCIFTDIVIFGDSKDKQFYGFIKNNHIYFSNRKTLILSSLQQQFSYNDAGCSCSDCMQTMLDIFCLKCDIKPITRIRFIDEIKYLFLYIE